MKRNSEKTKVIDDSLDRGHTSTLHSKKPSSFAFTLSQASDSLQKSVGLEDHLGGRYVPGHGSIVVRKASNGSSKAELSRRLSEEEHNNKVFMKTPSPMHVDSYGNSANTNNELRAKFESKDNNTCSMDLSRSQESSAVYTLQGK
jgi:hypothetical protein